MSSKPSVRYGILLHLTLFALSVLVVILVRENQQLKSVVEKVSASASRGVKVGDILPELEFRDPRGELAPLRFDSSSKESLVFVFETTCEACEKSVADWLDLHHELGESYDFVAIGLDGRDRVAAFAGENELPFRVLTPEDREFFHLLYGVSGVPQTMLVGTEGQVKDVRVGGLPIDYASKLRQVGRPLAPPLS